MQGPARTASQTAVHAALWAFCVLMFTYLMAPLLAIIPLSFNGGGFLTYPLDGVSLRWYRALIESADWVNAFKNSMIIGSSTTILATTLGTLAALGLSHDKFPYRGLVMALIVSPMVVPIVVVAVAIYFLFARLNLTQTYIGVILAHTMLAAPLVVITVGASLAGYNRNLTRAAFNLGAGPVRTFMKVILPLVLPGVVSGALLAFATSLDEVVIVIFVAGPDQRTLPRQMLVGIREYINPTITAAATMLILISILFFTAVELLRRRAERMRGAVPANP